MYRVIQKMFIKIKKKEKKMRKYKIQKKNYYFYANKKDKLNKK